MPNLYGELIRSQFENLAADPSQGTTGRIWWNTAAGQAKFDNGSSIRAFLLNDQNIVIGNTTAVSNVRVNRAGAAFLQFLVGNDATAEGSAQTDTTKWANIQAKIGGGLVDTFLTYANQGSTPATPASGFTALYAKADGFYRLDANGAETKIGAGSGAINYIGNPDAETNTTGWATYADTAGAAPVDGTGGSPTVTWTRSTTTPLRGIGMFVLTKDAANRQGQGASYDFTIANADKAQPLQINFEYSPSSSFVAGTGVAALSDVVIYLYDKTNAVLIQAAPFILAGGSGNNHKFAATFQTAYNSTSYRLIIHIASTNANAWTLNVDDVSITPQLQCYGAPIGDWTAYTPVLVGYGTPTSVEVFYRRVGDTYEIQGRFVSGTVTASTGSMSLPNSGVIDSTKTSASFTEVGKFIIASATGSAVKQGVVLAQGGASVVNFGADDYTTALSPFSTLNGSGINSSTQAMAFFFKVPIQGLSSNVLMSQDTTGRVVAMTSALTNAQTGIASKVIPFNNVLGDTHGTMNATTGVYTIPVSGWYHVDAGCLMLNVSSATDCNIILRQNTNGLKQTYCGPLGSGANGQYANISHTFYAKAGDQIDIFANGDVSFDLDNNGARTVFSIQICLGPAAIAASETVAAKAYNMTTSITTSGPVLVWATKIFDTHGALSTTTGLFTCPTAGKYKVRANFGASGTVTGSASTSTLMAVQKNGVQTNIIGAFSRQIAGALAPSFNGEGIEDCLAGDTLSVTIARDSGDSANFTSSGSQNTWVSFERLGGIS